MRLNAPTPSPRRATQHAGVRSILLPLICFLLGLALSAVWFQRATRPPHSRQPAPELSETTQNVLDHLTQPVEIRFYSLLDPAEPAGLGAFAQRVDQLLLAYQRQANGKISVTRMGTQTNADPEAAVSDGIKGFGFDKGQGSYLGIAFSSAGKKEVLPQLLPEWEPALEADITRSIERLSQAAKAPKPTATTTLTNTAMVQEVRQRIPNIDSESLEEGIRVLREDSIKEFAAATREMQARVEEAQARVAQAKNTGSAAEQEAAMKNLQTIQAEQAQRLKEIAANAQARIETFKQLKAAAK